MCLISVKLAMLGGNDPERPKLVKFLKYLKGTNFVYNASAVVEKFLKNAD